MDSIYLPIRRSAPILFLKAKKFANQPGYYLHNGRWHAIKKDKPSPADAKMVAAKHYQALAVKKLKGTPGFSSLSSDEQVAQVNDLAAQMQATASASAAVSLWKKAALAGKNPTPAQWKAFYSLKTAKRAELLNEVSGVAGLSHLQPPAPPKPAAATPEVEPDPNHSSVQDPDGKPLTAKQKIVVGGIEKYLGIDLSGTASYIKPSVVTLDISALNQQQIHAIENYGNQFGHFKVTPGGYKKLSLVMPKKPTGNGGDKPAAEPVKPAPTPAPEPAPEKPASPNPWTDEEWSQLYLPDSNTNASSHNKKIDALKNAADAGDLAAIQAMKFGSNTYGKKQAKIAEHLVAAMGGGKSDEAAPQGVSVKPKPAAQPAAPKVVHTFDNPDEGIATFVSKHADNKWVVSLKDTDAGEFLPSGIVYPTEAAAIESAKSAAGLKPRAPKAEPPKVSSVSAKKPAASAVAPPGAVVLHNTSGNHNKFYSAWVSGSTVHSIYGKIGTVGQSIAKEYGSPAEAQAALAKLINSKTAKGYEKVSGPANLADASPAVEQPAVPTGSNPWTDEQWSKLYLPDTNTNAPSHNKKIDELKSAADAGDVAAIQAMKFGKNTYGKKQAKIAEHLLAEMGAAKPDDGPKEGDTKQGADGLLVFKNGRWHKAEQAPPAQPQPEVAQIDGWIQVGGQMGSNKGGLYEAPDGTRWYCKFPPNPDHAKSELLAAALYEAAGVAVPHVKPVMRDGVFGIASKWQDGLSTVSADKLASAKGAHAGFAVDAWLANYDAVGLANDNMQLAKDGSVLRVDVGGSLEYRAQGKKKEFGQSVVELDTMRDAKVNPKAAAVFGKMTQADIAASVAKVAAIPDDMIQGLVDVWAPGTQAEKAKLAATLIARKSDLMAKYPAAVKGKKKRQDPTKLNVDPAKLPKPHDFANWHGPGKGLSSKAHVNEANNAVEQEMLAVAKKGNLPDLKAFQFHSLDKETGKPTGAAHPISEHPSKHVVQYHADLVQTLDEIANPPRPLKLFRSSDATTVSAIDAAFPPKPFGTTVGKVKSNEKLGFWVVLGGVTSVENLKPKKTSHISSSAVAAAHEKHKQASKLAKHFVKSVQASGSYNDLFRDGKTHDHAGHALVDVAKAALEHATSQPEGTTIYRWQNMSDAMVQKVLSAPDGTIIQATGPMCTSYSPTATKGFGKHRVMIHYAKGAKAVESFGSGGYASEKEITTLPNARFVVLSKQMVDDPQKGGKRLDLQLLMLPPDLGIPGTSK